MVWKFRLSLTLGKNDFKLNLLIIENSSIDTFESNAKSLNLNFLSNLNEKRLLELNLNFSKLMFFRKGFINKLKFFLLKSIFLWLIFPLIKLSFLSFLSVIFSENSFKSFNEKAKLPNVKLSFL